MVLGIWQLQSEVMPEPEPRVEVGNLGRGQGWRVREEFGFPPAEVEVLQAGHPDKHVSLATGTGSRAPLDPRGSAPRRVRCALHRS